MIPFEMLRVLLRNLAGMKKIWWVRL